MLRSIGKQYGKSMESILYYDYLSCVFSTVLGAQYDRQDMSTNTIVL